MPSVIIYKNLESPAQVVDFRVSVDPTPYQGRPDVKIYTDTTNPTEGSVQAFVAGKPLKYLKVSGDSVVDYTQGEKDALDAEEESISSLADRLNSIDQSRVRIWDDFSAGGTATGTIGQLGWFFTGGSVSLVAAVANRPGIVRRSTGATINTGAWFNFANSGGMSFLPQEYFDLFWIVRVNQIDAGTRIRFGIGDITADPPANGIYFERLETDGSTWFAVCRNAGTQTRVSVGAMTTNFHKLRIRRKSASVICFSLDGGPEIEVSANIPAVVVNPFSFIKNVGIATSKTIDHDYFDWTRASSIPGTSRLTLHRVPYRC